jgi:hypothetical protein
VCTSELTSHPGGSKLNHHRTVPWQLSVRRTPAALPPSRMWSSAVQQRRRVKQTSSLDQRLTDQAERLRKEARGTPPGIAREQLLRRARQAETAAHMEQWLTSPGLRAPS